MTRYKEEAEYAPDCIHRFWASRRDHGDELVWKKSLGNLKRKVVKEVFIRE